MSANPAENKPPTDPLAAYKKDFENRAKETEKKKSDFLASKGYELMNTDLTKIEIPDLGKRLLDEIENVKKRFQERETSRGNYGKLKEISMHDSRWLSNMVDFIKENSDKSEIIKKF
ncbi:MAG: hypothetical protein WC788_04695 [Candidatus Paceibacterota bacterium]